MNHEGARSNNYIRGQFFDIDLTGLNEAGALVDSPDVPECDLLSIDDENMLPPGFESIALFKSQRTTANGTPNVQGLINFYPNLVQDDFDWTEKFINNFKQSLPSDRQITTLPHDIKSLYLKISDDLMARIQPMSSIDICSIKIELTNFDYFDSIKNNTDTPDLGRQIETDSADIVREVASFLGLCFDAMVEGHYKVPKNSRIRLSLTEFTNYKEPPRGQNMSPEVPKSLGGTASGAVVPANQTVETKTRANIESINFDSIGGNFAVKQKLERLANQFLHRELAALYDLTPTNFLLLGEPGTGKTSLAKAFATKIRAEMVTITSTDVSSKWIGGSARNLQRILNEISNTRESTVLFFDEIDALIGKQADGTNQTEAKRVLQVALTDLPTKNPNVIFVAASNTNKDQLDQAFIRPGRFDVVEVTRPSQSEREDIWATIITNSIRAIDAKSNKGEDRASDNRIFDNVTEFNFKRLAELTDSWTGADVAEALKLAKIIAFNNFIDTRKVLPITEQTLKTVIANFNR